MSALDAYPFLKPVIDCLYQHRNDHELNMHIFQHSMQELIDITGDDDLLFELQDNYGLTDVY